MLRFVRFGLLTACVSSLAAALCIDSVSPGDLNTFRGGAACLYGNLVTTPCTDTYACNLGNVKDCAGTGNYCSNSCTGTTNYSIVSTSGTGTWTEDTGSIDCGFKYVNDPACQKKTNPNGKDVCACATGGQASKNACTFKKYKTGCGASTTPTTSPTTPQ